MKLNSEICIIGCKTILVPYKEHHVEKYNNWMQSTELQDLTASEPLTLEEEYEMQKSWSRDEYKCTFIILEKSIYDETNRELDSMIGDVNIYIINKPKQVGEMGIMIAEEFARGKKLGFEAAVLMLLYAIHEIHLKKIIVKVGFHNVASVKLFIKLGFEEIKASDMFQELTLAKEVSPEWIEWLSQQFQYKIDTYCEPMMTSN